MFRSVNTSVKLAVCNVINEKVLQLQCLEEYWTDQADIFNPQEKESYLIQSMKGKDLNRKLYLNYRKPIMV